MSARRLPAWTELQFAIGAAIRSSAERPPKELVYHAQRAQPLIRNAARSDEERVMLATLNALRDLTLAWVECDTDLQLTLRTNVVSLFSLVGIWPAELVAQAVSNAEDVRADRAKQYRERRAS